MSQEIELKVNGRAHRVFVEPDTPLLTGIRLRQIPFTPERVRAALSRARVPDGGPSE